MSKVKRTTSVYTSILRGIIAVSLTLPGSVPDAKVTESTSGSGSHFEISEEQREKNELEAVKYTVRTVELAASVLSTPEDAVEVFLENRSPEERKFILKKLGRGLPLVYRVNETTLAFDNLREVLHIDYKHALRNEIYVNGQLLIIHPERSLISEWPVFERRIESLLKGKSNFGTIDRIFDEFFPRAFAQVKKTVARGTMSALERAALRAEQIEKKVAQKKLEEDARKEAVEKPLKEKAAAKKERNDKLKTFALGGGIVGLASTVSSTLTGNIGKVLDDIAQATTCAAVDAIKFKTKSCMQYRADMEAIAMRSSGPQLIGARAEAIAQRAGDLFKTGEPTCRVDMAKDPIILPVVFKNQGIKVNAKLWYDGDKAKSATLTDAENDKTVVAKLDFTDGRLQEVCISKTKDELAAESVAAKKRKWFGTGMVLANPSPTRCIKEKERGSGEKNKDVAKDEQLDEFDSYLLLASLIDLKNGSCAEQKGKEAEKKKSDAPAPDAVPGKPGVKPLAD